MSSEHDNAGQIAAVCTKLRELAAISNLRPLTELLTAAEQEAYRVQFAYLAEKTKHRIEQKMRDFVARVPSGTSVTLVPRMRHTSSSEDSSKAE